MGSNLAGAQTWQIVAVYAAYAFLVLGAVCLIFMLAAVFRQGDERRSYILTKTCTHTFLIYTAIVFVMGMYALFFQKYHNFSMESTPVASLSLIAILFTGSLFLNKRKYGN